MTSPLYLTISLDRTPERWEAVKERFYALTGFCPVKVRAVDAQDYSEDLLSLSPNERESIVQRVLSKGEIACYLSHKKCWERLLESSSEWALVMEDDIYFVLEGEKYISSPDWIPAGVDVCQIGAYYEGDVQALVFTKSIMEINDVLLVKFFEPISWGTQAYWINRKAAMAALNISKKIYGPVDHVLFDQSFRFAKELGVYTFCPYVAYQKDPVRGSLLEKERQELRDAQNWFKDPWYVRLERKITRRYKTSLITRTRYQGKEV